MIRHKSLHLIFSVLLSWLVEFSWLCSTLKITALLAASIGIILVTIKNITINSKASLCHFSERNLIYFFVQNEKLNYYLFSQSA